MTLLYGGVDAAAFDGEPAIRAVDEIFDAAIAARASDVHIEPWNGAGRVRLRVDGILRESRSLSLRLLPQVLSRIKVLAGMDIADRRCPQDGRYAIEGRRKAVDARISCIPTIDGEKLAIRLLDGGTRIPTPTELGMSASQAERFRHAFHAANGFVVVCGPTGSGKTTTLYSALSERNDTSVHLCSIEDPVEIRLAGVAQMQVNVRAGVTFAAGLRAFVRQDPNAIAIGELRDAETAAVAASAALCGQLILTTLHAGDALGALERLAELGIAPRRVAAAFTAIVSQRLLRRLCEGCKRPATAGLGGAPFGLDSGTPIFEAAGCLRCEGSGYSGRCGIFEILSATPAIRTRVAQSAPLDAIRMAAINAGYEPMWTQAAQLLADGVTDVSEVRRICGGWPP